jgi:hypothetical protein
VSCSIVLALVTENWLASKWCFAEATHARSGGKTILGLTASRGVQPAILADTQLIDYSPDKRIDAKPLGPPFRTDRSPPSRAAPGRRRGCSSVKRAGVY